MIKIYLYCILFCFCCADNPSTKNQQNLNSSTVENDHQKHNMDEYDVFVDFPGGQDSLATFIKSNLTIPMDFKGKGHVFLTLKINEEGEIVHSTIIKSLTPSTNKEALRIVNLLPHFIPAKRNGEFVVSYYSFYITFDTQN